MKKLALISCFLLIGAFQVGSSIQRWTREEETKEFWYNEGRTALDEVLKRNYDQKPAKNIILFLGSGMGITTITAGRIFKGQTEGQPGEETVTMLDKFESVGLSKVYAVDQQSPDGASTNTAILGGVKTKKGLIGLNGKAKASDCRSAKGNEIESIFDVAAKEGKSIGLVTTNLVQNGNPASTYAHSPSKRWWSDRQMPSDAIKDGCKDISLQLFEMRNKINVVLGGGRAYMKPQGTADEEHTHNVFNGKRLDNRDLIKEWSNSVSNFKYVWNQTEFDKVDPQETDHLLGLFQPLDMLYEHQRHQDPSGEPSLSEMTKKAIQILQKNQDGYFLFVDASKIDKGHHGNRAQIALNEFLALEKATETAMNMTSLDDTLIIVSANHGHGFTLGGYSVRGNPINGYARSHTSPSLARDNKLYTAVTYANGPGHQGQNQQRLRVNPTLADIFQLSYRFQTAVPLNSATHSAEDAVVLASGPMSHLFSGTFEQNYISHAMKYATCMGPYKSLCTENVNIDQGAQNMNESSSSEQPSTEDICSEINKEKTERKVTQFLGDVDKKILGLLDSMDSLKSLRASLDEQN